VIFLVVCDKIALHVFSIDGYSCTFDTKISNTHKNEIFDFINMNKNFKTASLSFIAKHVTGNFPVVTSTKLMQLPSGILQNTLNTVTPVFLINDLFVVTKNMNVFDKSLFSKNSIASCGSLTVQGLDTVITDTVAKKDISDSCKCMMFRLPKKSFEQYQICRESETKSYMTDMLQKSFIVIFSDIAVPTEKILSACNQLKHELQARGEFSGKRNIKWLADVRFKDQIVLCKDRRRR